MTILERLQKRPKIPKFCFLLVFFAFVFLSFLIFRSIQELLALVA
jgi:hypothetical protein